MTNLELKNSRIQLLLLAFLGVLVAAGKLVESNLKTEKPAPPQNLVFHQSENPVLDIKLTDFDPNSLDLLEWQSLGFSEKQSKTILKYKEVVGGNFLSKEQLKKCFAISAEKFEQLNRYILLPEKTDKTQQYKIFAGNERKEINISKSFNPDLFSSVDWQKVGFSEKQAAAIIKYKNYLGGSFLSKEKFKECFIISPENYAKLSPYLLLPEKTPEKFYQQFQNPKSEKPAIQYATFDPNDLDVEGWKKLGFSEKQAVVIVNYRTKNLRGNFRNLEDVQKCFVISEEKFEEMKPWMVIKPVAEVRNENGPARTSAVQESTTDFTKVDLNQITFKQLLEFGFSERAAGSFVGYRKSLGGFVNKNQIYETYGIDRATTEKLAATAFLNSNNVEKYNLVNAPESWLKTHPYFKYSADKILYIRISQPDEKKIWKFIKTKPEYEAKMRLYLK